MTTAPASALTIRPARPDERPALIELQRRASLAHAAYRAALLAHPEAVDLPVEQITDGSVLVAELGGAVAGFIVVLPLGDGQAELDGLFVEPPLWRRGIGKALLKAGETQLRGFGVTLLTVIGAPEAEAFYAASGFVTVGPERTQFGPAIRMHKSLS
jgi:predicted N-acetyltransferase YhbS